MPEKWAKIMYALNNVTKLPVNRPARETLKSGSKVRNSHQQGWSERGHYVRKNIFWGATRKNLIKFLHIVGKNLLGGHYIV